MGDYLTYGDLTEPTAEDVLLACTPGSAEVMQTKRASFLQTITAGSTTLTGVGTIVLESGLTLTGESGDGSSVGSGTITASGDGGGTIPNDPIYGSAFSSGTWVRPALGSLTWVNQGSATAQDITNGPLILTQPSHSGNNLSILTEASPGGGTSPWTRTWLVQFWSAQIDYRAAGVCMQDAAGNIVGLLIYMGSGATLAISHYTSPTSGPSTPNTQGFSNVPPVFYLRIKYDGTNYYYYYSINGYNFTIIYSEAAGAFLSGPAVTTGIFVDNQNSGGSQQEIQLWSEYSSTP